MSDQYEDTTDEPTTDEDFKNLRAKARKADSLERENATLKRENAFIKAGVPMDDPRMSYFVKGYEGDLEPQAIKQAAIEAGFMQAPEQQVDPEVLAAQQGQAAVMAASTGVKPEFDENVLDHRMQQAYEQGGLQGLSDMAERYGVTFNPTPI